MRKELPLYENKSTYTIGRYIKENKESYTHMVDYTLLKPNLTIDEIKQHCETAKDNGCYAICIMPEFVSTAKAFLEDTSVKICTVISFPKGNDKTIQKIREADKAISDGADEIDMVMDYKKLKKLQEYEIKSEEYEKNYADILDDIRQLSMLCHKNGKTLKVIIESGDLTLDQVRIACEMCVDAGADFIKTSTGFAESGVGAELDKVKYMRKILPDYMKIKASGGIRTEDQVKQFAPYVDRVGTSVIPGGAEQKGDY